MYQFSLILIIEHSVTHETLKIKQVEKFAKIRSREILEIENLRSSRKLVLAKYQKNSTLETLYLQGTSLTVLDFE